MSEPFDIKLRVEFEELCGTWVISGMVGGAEVAQSTSVRDSVVYGPSQWQLARHINEAIFCVLESGRQPAAEVKQ